MMRLSGRLRSALIIGGQGIRARKTRTLLSIISLFLGVLAVVVVQAGAEAANRSALANIELTMGKDGTLQMYLPAGPQITQAVIDTFHGRTDAVAVLSSHAVIGEPGVAPINPGGSPFDQAGQDWGPPPGQYLTCDKNGNCKVEQGPTGEQPPKGQAIELGVTALTGDVLPFRPYRLQSGQWLDFSGPPSLSPRLVLNKEAAKGFSRYRVPAQMAIFGGTADATPRIIGVVDDGTEQPMAYVRSDELLNWVTPESAANYGGIQALMTPDAADIVRTLRIRLQAAGIPDMSSLHPEVIQARKAIAGQLALYRWIFLGIAGLVLLVGVAGILNVGLATVGERVEEFALRRAVGTPRSLLAGIVLAETMFTGLFTAAGAIGVAALCLKIISRVLGSRIAILADMDFPWQAGAAGIVAGLVAGLLGGFIPAVRAARIPIATVMRA